MHRLFRMLSTPQNQHLFFLRFILASSSSFIHSWTHRAFWEITSSASVQPSLAFSHRKGLTSTMPTIRARVPWTWWRTAACCSSSRASLRSTGTRLWKLLLTQIRNMPTVVFLKNPERYTPKTNIRLRFPNTYPPPVSAQWCSCTLKCFTVAVASCQVAAPAGHHMWTRPEQLQPAEGAHHAQHHDQPGPANTAGTQRMPHLLRAGSAGSLLSLPAQCGLRRWVETHTKKGLSTSV